MSDSNSQSVSADTDNLDDFMKLAFGKPEQEKPQDEATSTEEPEDSEDTLEDDTLAPENEDESEDKDDSPDGEDKPKEKPKSRFQERIDELTTKAKDNERRANDLEAKLNAAIEKLNAKSDEQKSTKPEPKKNTGPTPDDVGEDGKDKYPLGEYDPAYVRDLAEYTIEQKYAAKEAEQTIKQEKAKREADEKALEAEWNTKLEATADKYPDLKEKRLELVDAFEGVDPEYAEYIARTIMQLDNGPDVLYYLASNVDEARTIINSGALKATVALGRIEAQFLNQDKQQQKKVSKAPAPPATLNKGRMVSKEIPDDTDDLDAFIAKAFGPKKRWT